MPLHISEIGIHLAVGAVAGLGRSGSGPGPSGSDDHGGAGGALTPAQQDAIVAASVKQVLAALRLQQER